MNGTKTPGLDTELDTHATTDINTDYKLLHRCKQFASTFTDSAPKIHKTPLCVSHSSSAFLCFPSCASLLACSGMKWLGETMKRGEVRMMSRERTKSYILFTFRRRFARLQKLYLVCALHRRRMNKRWRSCQLNWHCFSNGISDQYVFKGCLCECYAQISQPTPRGCIVPFTWTYQQHLVMLSYLLT